MNFIKIKAASCNLRQEYMNSMTLVYWDCRHTKCLIHFCRQKVFCSKMTFSELALLRTFLLSKFSHMNCSSISVRFILKQSFRCWRKSHHIIYVFLHWLMSLRSWAESIKIRVQKIEKNSVHINTALQNEWRLLSEMKFRLFQMSLSWQIKTSSLTQTLLQVFQKLWKWCCRMLNSQIIHSVKRMMLLIQICHVLLWRSVIFFFQIDMWKKRTWVLYWYLSSVILYFSQSCFIQCDFKSVMQIWIFWMICCENWNW